MYGIDIYQYLKELVSPVSPFISFIPEPINILLHSRYCTHTHRPSRALLRSIRYPRPGSPIRSQIPPRIHASQRRCRCRGWGTWVGYTNQHCSSVTGTGKLLLSANPLISEYLSPTLKKLSLLHNFTIESQVQFHAPLAFKPQPIQGADGVYGLTQEDLTIFVNSAQWTLCELIGTFHLRGVLLMLYC